jgi:hypothetical protein
VLLLSGCAITSRMDRMSERMDRAVVRMDRLNERAVEMDQRMEKMGQAADKLDETNARLAELSEQGAAIEKRLAEARDQGIAIEKRLAAMEAMARRVTKVLDPKGDMGAVPTPPPTVPLTPLPPNEGPMLTPTGSRIAPPGRWMLPVAPAPMDHHRGSFEVTTIRR